MSANDDVEAVMPSQVISAEDDLFTTHYLHSGYPNEMGFATTNLIGARQVIKAFGIQELQVYRDEPSYAIYIADLGENQRFMLSLPRTQVIANFANPLAQSEVAYLNNNQDITVLSYSVITPYIFPTLVTTKLADELFDNGRFFQAVHNRGIFSTFLFEFVTRLRGQERLKIASSTEEAISWLKNIQGQIISE